MNIHEHQAKAVLAEFGVAVPRGFPAFSVEEAVQAAEKLGGPVFVVKSQIHAGGRGKGRFEGLGADAKGGVRVVKSVGEVKQNAQEMLGRVLVTHQTGPKGKQVNRLYIEEGAAIAKEFYLSLLVDRETSRVSVVASTEGGMDIEEVAHATPDKIVTFSIDPATGVWPHHGLELATALGLKGDLAKQARTLLGQLYEAFVAKDMSMLDLNPLIVTADDQLRVLDAKVSFDSNALFRHKDIVALRDESEEDPKEIEASKYDLSYIALDGEIGCMVNGAGLAMATMDIIKLYGAEPANFLDVGGGATQEKVTAAFKIIMADPNVKGILVNIFGGIARCDLLANGVVAAVKEVGLAVPLVVRLEGTNAELGKQIIRDSGLNVIPANDLADGRREKIVKAGKGRRVRLAAAAGIVTLAFATCAQAETPFELLQKLCIDTHAERRAVMALADARGWQRPPEGTMDELMKPTEPGEVVTDVDSRLMVGSAGLVAVVVAHTNRMVTKQDVPADVCAVGSGPGVDEAAFKAEAATVAGIPETPGMSTKGEDPLTGYLWREAGGKRQRLTVEELARYRSDPTVTAMIVMAKQGVALVGVAYPAK